MAYDVWFPNLGIKIKNLNNVAFKIMDFNIYWYGVIISTAIILNLVLLIRYCKKNKLDINLFTDYLFLALIFSIIGARLYYVIFSWSYYKDDLSKIFLLRNGGIAIYGAIIASLITLFVFTKIKNLNFFYFCDVLIPYLSLGQAIGRFGNFINKEAFGHYTDNIFAMRYMAQKVPYIPREVMEQSVYIDGTQYIQVHPTFLYESLACVCIFFILIYLRNRTKFNGKIIFIYCALYGIVRFFIEGIRTDSLFITGTNIAASQLLSAIISVVSIFYIFFRQKKRRY